MNDSTNICLSCGICCDGTLIGFVELDKAEMPALKNLMEIEDSDNGGFFLQPCKKFCDGCTIYAHRPKNCDNFKCKLLNSVDQKELGFETAVAIIEVVKQKKLALEAQLAELKIVLKSPSFYFKMVELRNLLLQKKSEPAFPPKHKVLLADLENLDSLLSKEFGVSLN